MIVVQQHHQTVIKIGRVDWNDRKITIMSMKIGRTISPHSEEQYFNKKCLIFFERVPVASIIARLFSLCDIAIVCLDVSDSGTIGALWIRRRACGESRDLSLLIDDGIECDELDDVLFFDWRFEGGEIEASDQEEKR